MIVVTASGFAIEGVINFNTVSKLLVDAYAVLRAKQSIVVDLQKVSTVNSAALALLLEWLRYCRQTEKRLQIVHIPKQLEKLIKVSELQSILS